MSARKKGHKDELCPDCGGSKDRLSYREGNFRKCPCGYRYYRVSFGKEFSAAMDAYAEVAISADELVQAGFDQEFADIEEDF